MTGFYMKHNTRLKWDNKQQILRIVMQFPARTFAKNFM